MKECELHESVREKMHRSMMMVWSSGKNEWEKLDERDCKRVWYLKYEKAKKIHDLI